MCHFSFIHVHAVPRGKAPPARVSQEVSTEFSPSVHLVVKRSLKLFNVIIIHRQKRSILGVMSKHKHTINVKIMRKTQEIDRRYEKNDSTLRLY